MRKFLLCGTCLLTLASVHVNAADRFDGKWNTKLTCEAKGETEGYTWQFQSVIANSNLRGEHGIAGQPGYLLIEGRIADNGNAKLTANGVTGSRKYTRGVFAHSGEDYTYDVKAQFHDADGKGEREQGMGIVGRPCHYEFVKQTATDTATKPQ